MIGGTLRALNIRIHGGIGSHILGELRQSNGIQGCNGSDGLLLQMKGMLKITMSEEYTNH